MRFFLFQRENVRRKINLNNFAYFMCVMNLHVIRNIYILGNFEYSEAIRDIK